MTPNEEHRNWARAKVVTVPKNILSGELGVVMGVRQLVAWRFDLGAEGDPDFVFLVGVDSESDHLPIGDVRSKWDPEALKTKDGELRRFEDSIRDKVLAVCHSLIKKYERTG